MKHLVFLTLNCSFSHSGMVLPMLHSACADLENWQWHRVESTTDDDLSVIASQVAAFEPDLVCASCYLFNRREVLDVLGRIHALSPACRIAVGGPEALGEGAEKLLAYPFIHTVFRGEGETEFRAFLENGLPPGIFPADGNGVFEDWAECSLPVADEFFRTDKPFVQVETSRGCPMGCAYCTSGGTQLRLKPLERVREELTLLHSKGVRDIRLLDRTFNLPYERSCALLKMFREEFPDIHFHLEIHPQFLNDELKKELSSAKPGQLHLEAGIQTLDESVQQLIGRKSPPDKALEGLRFLCNTGRFETHADLLAGLPGQTLKSLFKDIDTLLEVSPAEIQLEVLKILPGTPLKQQTEEFGIVYAPEPPYDVMKTSCMTTADILEARLASRLLDLLANHAVLHGVLRTMYRENPQVFPALLTFFKERGLELRRLYSLQSRFAMLQEFLTEDYPESRKALAYAWLDAGYAPGEGAAQAAEKLHAFPEELPVPDGFQDKVAEKESRCYRIYDRLYVFNRRYSMNLPMFFIIAEKGGMP